MLLNVLASVFIIIIIIIINDLSLLWIFHISFNWGTFTVWVTTIQIRSPGLFWYSSRSRQWCGLDGHDSCFDFQFFRYFSKTLGTVPRAPIMIGIIFILMFYSFFNYLAKSKYLSFNLLSFPVCGPPTRQHPQDGKFFFLVNQHLVWSSGQD